MHIRTIFCLFGIALFVQITIVNGQGCSDAGICTLHSLKPQTQTDQPQYKRQIKSGVSVGKADHSILVIGSYVEYNQTFKENWTWGSKLTALAQSGNGISTSGLSDLFMNITRKTKKSGNFTLGIKIPLMLADKRKNNLALPMDYQASLGTYDLIAGYSFAFKKVQYVLGFQQPLSQNKNAFFSELYPTASALSSFTPTNHYQRKPDLMLRISYPIQAGKKFKITPGVLPIYHLANDTYTDLSGLTKEITGSQGLTFNGTLFMDYQFDAHHTVQVNAGGPLKARQTRPDGLTRSYVFTVEYGYLF
ncbi:MAG: hypothetical protein WC760_09585 [Bacteroidia bacterium]